MVKQNVITALFLLSSLFLAGCEQPFEPIQENDKYPFSIHGYLDASAESNWVRVTAVRDTLFMGDPDSSIDAVVTLEDLESGETVTMKDSLHRFSGDNFAFNFWTEIDLEPDKVYHITTERSDGMTSSATVTTPPDFPDPFIRFSDSIYPTDTLVIPGIQHLADVVVTYYVEAYFHQDPLTKEFDFRHLADTTAPRSDKIIIRTYPHLSHISGVYQFTPFRIKHREVKVSSAGPDWRYFSSIDNNLISLPEGTSNIENGTGYIVGIVSKTIPYEGLPDHLTEPPDLP